MIKYTKQIFNAVSSELLDEASPDIKKLTTIALIIEVGISEKYFNQRHTVTLI